MSEIEWTTLKTYDKSQFEIKGKKLNKFIGDGAKVWIPEGVSTVGRKAFEGKNNITELHIPGSVTQMARDAFVGCDKIKKVDLPLGLAKDVETLTKFFGENVAKIDFSFLLECPIDFDTLSKLQQELGKIHIDDEGSESEFDLDIDFSKEDPVLKDVIRMMIEKRQISASLIHRNFGTGYVRASAIIDLLESKGIIGPQEGAKPREIYLDSNAGKAKLNGAFMSANNDAQNEVKDDASDIGFDKQPDLLKTALRIFIKTGTANCSILQRRFSIGYNRAVKILRFFEEMKFVSPDLGGGRRDVLITKEGFERLFGETVELTFRLTRKHFKQVCSGQKTVDFRIEKVLLPLALNDIIYFVCGNKKITAKVIGWSRENDLKDYSQESLDRAGYAGMSEQEIIGELNKYYTKKEIKEGSYVAILFDIMG